MEEHGSCCGAGGEGKCCSMHQKMCSRHLLKKIVMIVVMIFMFWIGLQLGELRTLTRMQEYREYGNGYRMMGVGIDRGAWNTGDVQQGAVDLKAPTTTPDKTAVPTTTK